jgi:hypothetical protein
MKMHANARLSLKGRELLIDRVENAGWSLSAAAEAAGISDRTAPRDETGYWIAPPRLGTWRTALRSDGSRSLPHSGGCG